MQQTDEQFAATREKGFVAEGSVSRFLRAKGCLVLPTYGVDVRNSRGPVLHMPHGQRNLTAPDMLCIRLDTKHQFWAECKSKSTFSLHRRTGRWVTGIDLRAFDDYRAVQDATGVLVKIYFLHEHESDGDRRGLYVNTVDELRAIENHRYRPLRESDAGAMIYWSQQSLRRVATIEQFRALTGPHNS